MSAFPRCLRQFVIAGLLLLSFAALAQGTDDEPNNACAAAQDVGMPVLPFTIPGSLDTVGGIADIDFFRFAANPGDFIQADHQGASSGSGTLGDPLLGLFDADCIQLGVNDDAVGVDSRLLFTVPDDGTFILAATAYPDFEFLGTGEGSYLLTVSMPQIAQSVSGRLVSARDGSPLPGDGPTSAFVQLIRCLDGVCFEFVGFQPSDADGFFRFDEATIGVPLLAGSYQIQANANGFEFLATEIFDIAAGQALDLGDIAMTPFRLIGSVSGRLVDAVDGTGLSGFGPPFSFVILERCDEFSCAGVAGIQPDELGNFEFDGVLYGLAPGTYRVSATADEYRPTATGEFDLAEFEKVELGNIFLAPLPIQFGAVHGCDLVPGGGLCEFGIELRNRGPGRFKGEAWSTVDYFPNQVPFRGSRFQVGNVGTTNPMPDKLNLGKGQSVKLRFQLQVPPDLPEFSLICATATVGADPNPQFRNFGDRFLFCAVTQSGNLEVLSEKEGRKRMRELRGQQSQ